MQVLVAEHARTGIWILWTGVKDVCKPLCVCWKPNCILYEMWWFEWELPHRLLTVTTRSPVSGTVWEVLGVALLEKYVKTRWMTLIFEKPTYSQLPLCLSASWLRIRAYAVSLLPTAMMVIDSPSTNCNLSGSAFFYNCLRHVSHLISRKATKTNSKCS